MYALMAEAESVGTHSQETEGTHESVERRKIRVQQLICDSGVHYLQGMALETPNAPYRPSVNKTTISLLESVSLFL